MATLTLPPFFLFPLLIPALSVFFLLIQSAKNTKQRFWIGWCFGLGYFVTGLYWFAYSLLVDAEKFAWMIPFAVLGLPSFIAIFYGVATAAYGKIAQRAEIQKPLSHIALFALIFVLVEFARGHVLTGFPWNPIALGWVGSLPLLQFAGILGNYGLSWWMVLLAILPAITLTPHATPHTKQAALLLCLMMLVLPYGYGIYHLSQNPTQYTEKTLKLVQPSIPQQMKMKPDQRVAMIEKQVEMSKREANKTQVDLVIWSETAYPFAVQSHSPPLKYIAKNVLPQGSHLITGGVRIDGKRITNSLNVIDFDANVVAAYDKIKLVPFGEFMPLRWLLPKQVESIAQGMGDFNAGGRGQLITFDNIPTFLPLICYEVIFPEMASSPLNKRPKWLLNITNDGWFGESTGPYQHFAMARLRAAEQGLPLVRVANNGISAVIDGQGRVLQQLGLNAEGVLRGRLPQASAPKPYARWGDGVILAMILTFSICFIVIQRRGVVHNR
jgi:apolipoprotein N-acyltransferase